jgi:hypothetical protein
MHMFVLYICCSDFSKMFTVASFVGVISAILIAFIRKSEPKSTSSTTKSISANAITSTVKFDPIVVDEVNVVDDHEKDV